jgi:hypothetical protein
VGCSPNSLEDFHHEGEAVVRQLTEDLRAIQSREDLQSAFSLLQRRFDTLVSLMIEARKYQGGHSEEDFQEISLPCDGELLKEMQRLYRLEGGREIIERAQREALLRLDAFERAFIRERNRIK